MPFLVQAHEMVSIGYDLILIGGATNDSFLNSIYKLSCSNHMCKWDKLQEELKTTRVFFTAIPLPEEFIDCN